MDVGAVDRNGNGSGSRVFRRAQLPEQVQAASRPPERQHMILPPEPDLHRFDELEREREGRPVAGNANAIASTNSSSARERERDRDRDRARALERDSPAMPTHVGRASPRCVRTSSRSSRSRSPPLVLLLASRLPTRVSSATPVLSIRCVTFLRSCYVRPSTNQSSLIRLKMGGSVVQGFSTYGTRAICGTLTKKLWHFAFIFMWHS